MSCVDPENLSTIWPPDKKFLNFVAVTDGRTEIQLLLLNQCCLLNSKKPYSKPVKQGNISFYKPTLLPSIALFHTSHLLYGNCMMLTVAICWWIQFNCPKYVETFSYHCMIFYRQEDNQQPEESSPSVLAVALSKGPMVSKQAGTIDKENVAVPKVSR